jgi:hypothetical protein
MALLDTDLSESLDSLRYLVAVPGTFASVYPDTTEDMLLQILRDGFAEAQLMGLFSSYTIDEDGIVEPGLSGGEIALVVLFSAIRLIRVAMLNSTSSVTYKAGSAEYATTTSATLLKDILDDLKAQKNAVIALLSSGGTAQAGEAFAMADQFLIRVLDDWYYGPAYEGALAAGW